MADPTLRTREGKGGLCSLLDEAFASPTATSPTRAENTIVGRHRRGFDEPPSGLGRSPIQEETSIPSQLDARGSPPSSPCRENNALQSTKTTDGLSTPLSPLRSPPPMEKDDGKAPWRPWGRRVVEEPTEKRRREIQSILNKLTVEKFPQLAEKLALLIENNRSSPLPAVRDACTLLTEKALSEPNFTELYADMTLVLYYRAPLKAESPADSPSAILMNAVQEAYQKIRNRERDVDLSEDDVKTTKSEILGLSRFIGELYIRGLMKARIVQEVIQDLLCFSASRAGTFPSESHVECVCEFCFTAGPFLDERPGTSMFLQQILGRLTELQKHSQYSTRLGCIVQDVLDAKKSNWCKKVHKEKAKSLSQIKNDALREEAVGGSHVAAQVGMMIKLGQRTNMSNAEYSAYMKSQEERYDRHV